MKLARSLSRSAIPEFLLRILPKYVAILPKARANDRYSKPGKVGYRDLDIALIDANSSIDIIEIRRLFDEVLLSRTSYRDN
ncbi:hypothetical protein [Sphingobium terrigena]|uniref:hypothetical protein n=1 Tax=Sphingobium terrigena TaxID=2304063 RepID=UPI0015FFF33D|nr:hypothetical protein [Sphingobium terrigena]